MHGAWLNEFEAREESQAKRLRDQAQQAALGRRCQRQFLLKFFNAVRDSIFMHYIFAYDLGKADEEVLTQLIQDIDDADWPSYPLANHLPDLLGVRFDEVELLDISTRTWFHIRKGHAIPLTSNLHVFIRRRGVKCQDFEHHYNLFIRPPRTPNIRTHMRGERRHIAAAQRATTRTIGTRSGSESLEILDSDDPIAQRANRRAKTRKSRTCQSKTAYRQSSSSDIEDIDVFSSPPSHVMTSSLKRLIKDEPEEDFGRQLKRPRYTSGTLACGSASDVAISIGSSSEPSTSPEPPSLQQHLSTPSPSPYPPDADETSTVAIRSITPSQWPMGWYTIDILEGFMQMEETKNKILSVERRFENVFQVPWQKSTYYDARRRLTKLRQCDIDMAMAASRSQAGLWSLLAKEAPLWPVGWYTVDILDGFLQMDSAERKKMIPSVEERFEAVFQAPWQKSTYYDARRRLAKLRQCDIDVSVAAARSQAGLWSLLAKEAPLRD
jgi:hypothetical protein